MQVSIFILSEQTVTVPYFSAFSERSDRIVSSALCNRRLHLSPITFTMFMLKKKSKAYKINNFPAEMHPVVFHFGNTTREGNSRELPEIPTSDWGMSHDRHLYHTHFHAEDAICICVTSLSHESKGASTQLNPSLQNMSCWPVASYQQTEKAWHNKENISFFLYPAKAMQEKQGSLKWHILVSSLFNRVPTEAFRGDKLPPQSWRAHSFM